MSADTYLAAAVSAVLSGGVVGSGITLWTASKKVPVERDAIAVTGAETAVMSLERSLAAETKRADRAEAKVLKQDARIEQLEQRLDDLQTALDGARVELHALLTDAKKK